MSATQIKMLWTEYQHLPEDKKAVAARRIVARLFGEAEHFDTVTLRERLAEAARREIGGVK